MVTAPDDDILRTHDDAQALLDYAVPGAIVYLDDWRRAGPRETRTSVQSTRRYTIVLPSAPYHAPTWSDTYSLPCRASRLAERARIIADEALADLRRRQPAVNLSGYQWQTSPQP